MVIRLKGNIMSELVRMLDCFWVWCENSSLEYKNDISMLPFDPLTYPQIDDLRNKCINLINSSLSQEEIDAFLTCMALDSEEELILDACKSRANKRFLFELISAGVHHLQSEARWQVAELLSNGIPGRESFLAELLNDPHPYVRKRAVNVAIFAKNENPEIKF